MPRSQSVIAGSGRYTKWPERKDEVLSGSAAILTYSPLGRFVRYPGGIRFLSSNGGCCSAFDGVVVGALCASFAARLANFFCSRSSALARCFSCRFISFWRFWKVVLKGLLARFYSTFIESRRVISAVHASGGMRSPLLNTRCPSSINEFCITTNLRETFERGWNAKGGAVCAAPSLQSGEFARA